MAKTLSGGRGWLADAAADSIHRMDKAYGGTIAINSAGRTNAEQWAAWRKYQNGTGALAAYPGTSIHETGNAVDFRNNTWAWLGSGKGLGWNGARANGFGWRRTVASEAWHYEYDINHDIALAQTILGIPADGIQGPQTTQALKNFQSRNGLTVDGILGPKTMAKLRASAPSGGSTSGWPARDRYGEAHVKDVQSKLNRLGYSLVVDGKDGPDTQAAVRDFQKKHGIEVDGIAGPITLNKINAVVGGTKSSGKLIVDGDWGEATTKALQKVLGVTVDGKMGPQTIKALQSRLKVTADGEMGPQTIRALQAVVGSTADGQMGPNTVKALQNYLNAGGNFSAKVTPTPSTPNKLEVDGQWGAATTRALQARLKVTVDGEVGPETYKALQKALGVTADGIFGPQTIRALQTFLGVSVDGQVGPQTVKALQTFLNGTGQFKKVDVAPEPERVTFPKPEKPTFPGATWWDHSPNCSPRDDKVQYFVVHHVATTTSVANLRSLFMGENARQVSPNWLIGADGSISEIVPPDNYRAWTSGQFDHKAVTVETQNTSGDPTWGISEKSREAIARLVAWASKRYGFPVDSTHVIGHKNVPGAATACPGPDMNVPHIIELAKKILADEATEPVVTEPEVPVIPTPEPEKPLTLDSLAARVKVLEEEVRKLKK